MIVESLNQNYILCSQLLIYLRLQALLLLQNLILLATEPSVSHAEASQSVIDFWYYSCPSNQINIDQNVELTDLILEVKELWVIHP